MPFQYNVIILSTIKCKPEKNHTTAGTTGGNTTANKARADQAKPRGKARASEKIDLVRSHANESKRQRMELTKRRRPKEAKGANPRRQPKPTKKGRERRGKKTRKTETIQKEKIAGKLPRSGRGL